MSKIYLLVVMCLSFINAIGQSNTFPPDGNVGVGTAHPEYRFQMVGGHSNTNMNLYSYHPDPTLQAHLTLWASEPGWTYTGTGIGNNVYNSSTASGVIRINTSKGGSYVRLMDEEIRLNVINKTGLNITALAVDKIGNVGVGTVDTKGYKLAVAGNVIAESIKVQLSTAWPDYVFSKSYQLPTLSETEKFIREKGHLPGIPSASEVKANGVDLGEMNALLLKKIEELTLHLIDQNKTFETKLSIQEKHHQDRLNLQDQKIKVLMEKLDKIGKN